MIISRTPYRISFFGGGTDYPDWYLREGGAVLSTTIDKYCLISCRVLPPFFQQRHRIVWSHIETVHSIAEILHPAVREGLRYLGFDDSVGIELHHQGDLPARAGIGSSSSFVVGLLSALCAMRGERPGRHELALRAIELEQRVLREHVGSQDQIAAAYGGLNRIDFHATGQIEVTPVALPAARLADLESRLVLIYTGTSRLASQVAQTLVAGIAEKHAQLRKIRSQVDEALELVTGSGDLDDFGRMLHEGWRRKRELSSAVTNPTIDAIYELAISSGALGGKLLGAGGAGFMVFYAAPDARPRVEKALERWIRVPFHFESLGTHLLHREPELPPSGPA